jgi:hypothetical protein
MTTIVIEDSCIEARRLVEYVRTLPYATVTGAKADKKSFREAAEECNAISVRAFTDELRRQIDEYFNKHA